jgi:hypothetical protein
MPAIETEKKRAGKIVRPDIWTNYRVRFNFLTKVCAQTPGDPELIRKWLEVRQPNVRPAGGRSIDEINAEVVESLARGEGEADQDYSLLVFQRYQGALVFRHGTLKAHIKDCARVLSAQYVGRIQGERAFSTRVINGVYLDPHQYWIPLMRGEGLPCTEPDGAYDKPVHAKGVRGEPINCLKRFEYIAPPAYMEFTLKVLGHSVKEDDLHYVFTYGGTHGYAGERSDGEGRYDYELEQI